MIFLLSILICGSLLAAVAPPQCQVSENPSTPSSSAYTQIVCYNGADTGVQPDPEDPSTWPVLSASECEQLKHEVGQIHEQYEMTAAQLISSLDSMKNIAGQIVQTSSDIIHTNWLANVNGSLDDVHTAIQNDANLIESQARGFSSEVDTAKQALGVVTNKIELVIARIQTIQCTNQVCSSGSDGSISCPCVDQFNQIMQAMRDSPFSDLLQNSTHMLEHILSIRESATNLLELVSRIVDRLEAPDDRMQYELNSILEDYVFRGASSVTNVYLADLDMTDVLYRIRQLLRGDAGGEKLQLSTEGIIQLYDSLGTFFNYAVLQKGMQDNYTFFTNAYRRMFSMFDEFNQTFSTLNAAQGKNNLGASLDVATSRQQLFNAATNNLLPVNMRYRSLQGGGGLTNWFSRIEFYLQSSLGWYDQIQSSEVLENNSQLTESSFEHNIKKSTNQLETVSSIIGSSTNRVYTQFKSFTESFSMFEEYQAYAPSRLVLSPEFSVGSFSFDGVIVNPSVDWTEYLEPIRQASTFVVQATWVVMLLILIRGIFVYGAIVVYAVVHLFKE